jgi:chemotaxis protein MotB
MAENQPAEEVIPEECKCVAGAPRWVVTFGDMMSLLLCFFVLLLSFSSTDVAKYKEAVGSLKEAFGVMKSDPSMIMPGGDKIIATQIDIPPSLTALVTIRAKAKKLAKNKSKVDMDSGADWVRIKVPGDTLFDSGKSVLKQSAIPILSEIGDIILNYKGEVSIEGHTDNAVPRSGDAFANYRLGFERATAVLAYMVVKKSVDKKKISPASFADTRPRETNALPEGRSKNRRVEFVFTSGSNFKVDNLQGELVKPQ